MDPLQPRAPNGPPLVWEKVGGMEEAWAQLQMYDGEL